MSDFLAIIDRIIAEHRVLRMNENRAVESINDMDAIFRLQKASSEWSQRSLGSLVELRTELQATLNILERGIKRHFSFEEQHLPPIFGETIMGALVFEHDGARGKIGHLISTVSSTHLENLNQAEKLAQKSRIQQLTYETSRLLEEHYRKEETILQMIKSSLQKNKSLDEVPVFDI